MTVSESDIGQWVRTSTGHEGILQDVMRDWEDPYAPSWERRRYEDMAIIRPERGGVERMAPVEKVSVVPRVPSSDGRGRRR
ncbi:hypothetical protein [Streptomyces luteireticuli]|uniref:Uncharacterized protein n=1 Tax=Streptomyces luteireticuli TaxID=173858 RepID=A0ABP3IZG3_9ACTN